jgi:signal transduction histidine kinase/ligand-binding sensor domain-containing protein
MRSRWILCVWLCLCSFAANAQWDTLRLPFRAITIEDGLSQGMVNTIIQDRYGFMWFGTKDGLNRYDGYSFSVFRHDPKDSTSISDNSVRLLFEDREGRIWVGTQKGLDLYLPEKGIFLHTHDGPVQGEDMPHTMVQDRNGDLWVTGVSGLQKMTLTGRARSDGLPVYTVKRILQRTAWVAMDRSGTLWASELDHGSYRILPEHGGNDRIDTLRMDHPVGNDRHGRDLLDLTGMMVVEDTMRGVVYGLHKFGVVRLDPSGTAVRSIIDFTPPYGDMRSSQVSIDGKGRLWISAYPGLFQFEPDRVRMHLVRPVDPNHVQGASVVQMNFRDRNGLLWIGTSGYGLLTYDDRTERFHTVPGRSCGAMSAGPNGRISITLADHFMAEYDPRNDTWPMLLPFSTYLKRPELQVFRNGPMFPRMDAEGAYWFNYAGIARFDPQMDAIERFPRQPSDPYEKKDDYCAPLFLDGDSLIWFGSSAAFGNFDRRTRTYRHWPYPEGVVRSGQGLITQAIHRGKDRVFWLGTVNGLLRFDPGNGSWKHFISDPADSTSLSANAIFCITPDPQAPDDVLWIGTNGGGMDRFVKTTGESTHYGTVNGLPNDVVYGILSDATGRLWLSTNKGIARFDPRNGRVRTFRSSDGLQSDEFNRFAYCALADGSLCFGGVNGLNRFHPEELVEDSTPVAVRITGVRLINRPIDFRSAGSPLSQPPWSSAGLTVPYRVNMITFEFASMEFAAPNEHRYMYRLDGFDKDWIMSGTEHSAVYTNLDPGTYTFHVRGDNRDGIWDERGTSFMLTVLPPWYRTWWAYGLFALVAGLAAALYMRSLGDQRRRLERTVAVRTAELRAAKDRAEQSERVKQQFLANMSHEIRTPMNAIVGMTGILRREPHPPEQQPYLDAIASSSENLVAIVNDILDLSRIEAGRLPLENVTMDVRTVLNGVQEVMRYRAEEKGLRFTTNVAADVPPDLVGDPVRLNQVLMNLVGNAIKFTERGSVHVELSVKERLREGVMLLAEVTDTGIGIATERAGRIFEEFTQAEAEHTRKYGGTGLGLAICKRLVEMQGGTIHVRSEEGKGSTFTATIPYRVSEAPARRSGPASVGARPVPVSMEELRVLLAEDHAINVMVAQAELAEVLPNAHVDVAENGARAVEMVTSERYDLVLMDVQMPVMDGYAATRAIRALVGDRSRVPIIAMTANVMKAEVDRCREAGMNGFIPKPFQQAELATALANALATVGRSSHRTS